MEKGNFVDFIRVFCKSGKGGAGCVHFRREKYVDNGGPDGGDGGRGGHVILRGNKQMWTLLHLRYVKHVVAPAGVNGSGNNCTGGSGKDQIIEVPLGTVAYDEETQAVLAEVLEHGEEKIILQGGIGGKGNNFFATSTKQAPDYAQPGEPGKEATIGLELKVLADVGMVGFPNAGKSTLLSVISAAKPKIANYAFTTLTPQLGMVMYKNNYSFCVADLPGIIEGAAEGRGLGHRFLRHIERNACLLIVIPADSDDHLKEYKILMSELEQYNPELLDKQRIIAISKCELLDDELKEAVVKELAETKEHMHFFSSLAHIGLEELKDEMWRVVNEE
ncbi:MAG: GTPase ObgE [Bacteroidota bacterium]|jgi:GTP-binding protein